MLLDTKSTSWNLDATFSKTGISSNPSRVSQNECLLWVCCDLKQKNFGYTGKSLQFELKKMFVKVLFYFFYKIINQTIKDVLDFWVFIIQSLFTTK